MSYKTKYRKAIISNLELTNENIDLTKQIIKKNRISAFGWFAMALIALISLILDR